MEQRELSREASMGSNLYCLWAQGLVLSCYDIMRQFYRQSHAEARVDKIHRDSVVVLGAPVVRSVCMVTVVHLLVGVCTLHNIIRIRDHCGGTNL